MCRVKKKMKERKKKAWRGIRRNASNGKAERVPALSVVHIRQYRVRMYTYCFERDQPSSHSHHPVIKIYPPA